MHGKWSADKSLGRRAGLGRAAFWQNGDPRYKADFSNVEL
jgi:hypothetical protein